MLIQRADQRRQVIKEVTDIQHAAAEKHAEERARAKAMLQGASQDLVEIVNTAMGSGMTQAEIAQTIGVTPTTISKLRKTIEEWKKED